MDYEELNVEFIHETEEAVLIDDDNNKIWLPKSQLNEFDEDIHEKGDYITIKVAEWLAIQKELC